MLPGARSVAAEGSGYQRVVRDFEVRPGENRLDFRLEGAWSTPPTSQVPGQPARVVVR